MYGMFLSIRADTQLFFIFHFTPLGISFRQPVVFPYLETNKLIIKVST